jgi:hypothetical protein
MIKGLAKDASHIDKREELKSICAAEPLSEPGASKTPKEAPAVAMATMQPFVLP